ncbi:MAG TPA: lytic murein transglycosylase [Gaiellaceae bacterium]|nr:lytic murein transglycosylase [Gaiellaceae bacterium]
MKRFAAVAVLAFALAGSAGADIFKVVPNTPAGVPAALPSAAVPNAPGSIALPPDWLSAPASPESLSYPQLVGLWQQAGAAYGIRWQVLAAINKVESNFGRNMGPSSAGAIGWMQFMPSTWERWGVDANGDGIADPWNAQDAITSAARYLAASGGRTDVSGSIYSYNHAQWYVDEVLQLAQLFGSGGVQTTFTLDRLQVSLDAARAAVVHVNRRLVAAERQVRRLLKHERSLRVRAARARVLSDQLELERLAAQAGIVRSQAQGRAAHAQAAVAKAQQSLDSARDRSLASSFAPAAGTMLGSPSYAGNYVFPVGGGPSVVSVSHFHHDYPAADIAAPMGSPVYALSDAVVQRSWTYPDPRCGIGVTLATTDGKSWTYCHLSALDRGVVAGTHLAAGQEIGLVGMTGDATGPHLHLQLNPQSVYPQSLPWFQGFANVAFRWQDPQPTDYAPPPTPTTSAPVFAVVPTQQQAASVVLFTK